MHGELGEGWRQERRTFLFLFNLSCHIFLTHVPFHIYESVSFRRGRIAKEVKVNVEVARVVEFKNHYPSEYDENIDIKIYITIKYNDAWRIQSRELMLWRNTWCMTFVSSNNQFSGPFFSVGLKFYVGDPLHFTSFGLTVWWNNGRQPPRPSTVCGDEARFTRTFIVHYIMKRWLLSHFFVSPSLLTLAPWRHQHHHNTGDPTITLEHQWQTLGKSSILVNWWRTPDNQWWSPVSR